MGDPEKRDHPQSASWKEVLMLLEEKGLELKVAGDVKMM